MHLPTSPQPRITLLTPLRLQPYRVLWLMWVVSNMSMWMGNVAAAWMMALLPVPPLWVTLVQAATSLPVLLFSLPFGTLADRLDRRHMLMLTQVWLGLTALVQAGLAMAGLLSPVVLLVMTFAYGSGFAFRLPAFTAMIPDLVPRSNLPAAAALNASAMHLARIVGPLIAGVLIAWVGTSWVFAAVAAMSLVSLAMLWRWTPPPMKFAPPDESFVQSLRGGLAFFVGSRSLRGVVWRCAVFFGATSALPALLPVVARDMPGGDASTFPMLLAAMGAGAVTAMVFLMHLREHLSFSGRIFSGSVLYALAMGAVAFTHTPWLAATAMFFAGIAMLAVQNTLNVAAQDALPDTVRARGMALYQMSLLGSGAIGAAVWGQLATVADVPTSLAVAAVTGVVAMGLVGRWRPMGGEASTTQAR